MRVLVKITAPFVMLLLPALAVGDHLRDGLAALSVGEYDKAMTICMPYAEAGDRAGQFCVGQMYANGFGVEMNDDEALRWYGLAAEQGHAEAQFNLGVMYANGWGVPVDDALALDYYRKAANQGFTIAQMALAAAIHAGRGCDSSKAESYRWYAIAARLGNTNAEFKRDDIAGELNAEQLQAADAAVEEWLGSFEGEALQAGRID